MFQLEEDEERVKPLNGRLVDVLPVCFGPRFRGGHVSDSGAECNLGLAAGGALAGRHDKCGWPLALLEP